MTTGERLVDLSTLATGTAMDHFLNIECEESVGGEQASTYMEGQLTRLLFMNEDLPFIGDQGGLRGSVIAGNYYMALFTDNPGEAGDLVNEADYGGYGRVPVVRGPAGWEYKDGAAKNIPVISWMPNTGASQVITHFAVMDSLVDGSVLWYGELPDPITVNLGDSVQYAYNQFSVKLY